MNSTKAWLVLGAASLGALAVIFYGQKMFLAEIEAPPGTATNTEAPLASVAESAWIELDFGNGAKRLFQGELGSASYPFLLALQSAADNGRFNIRAQKGKLQEIADTAGAWRVYKNGQILTDPVDDLVISGGDRYSLRVGE